jgi:hypothetical protein
MPEIDFWPQWLAEIYGPAPEGPRRREVALRRDAKQMRDAMDRLARASAALAPEPPARTRVPREYTAEEMRKARIELGIEPARPPQDRNRRDSAAVWEPLEATEPLGTA